MDQYIHLKVDPNTGETTEVFGKFIPEEQEQAIKKKSAAKENLESQDNFIWALFNYCSKLFPDMCPPNLTRLFYLATFIEYNGNRLTLDGGYTFMNKRIVKVKLGLTDKVFTEFWNEMTIAGILSEDNNKYVIINTHLFRKGTIDKRCQRDFTRIYCQCVRYIYENCTNIRDHAKISYIFKIIPFVNRKTNIVCFNPDEMDEQKINPMSFGDFCDAVKYDRSNASRLFKDLMKFTVQGKHLMCYVAIDNYAISKMFMIINPNIYYGGIEHNNAKFIFDVCDRQSNQK